MSARSALLRTSALVRTLRAVVVLAFLAAGCAKERAVQVPAAAGPHPGASTAANSASNAAASDGPKGASPASAAAVPTRIAGPAAFDLALVEGGALLTWSPPLAQGGGLYVQRLDARGSPREPARRLTQTDAGGEVVELAATGVGTRVGVAWLESSADESRTRALLVTPGEPSPPEPVRLALGKGGLLAGRSRLAVGGGREGRMRILYASSADDCGRGNSEPCTGYSFSELGQDGPRGIGGEWLRVPSPCPDVPPLLGAANNALYYAVCADVDGARLTTAYGVDVQSEYAHAVQVLAGCTPTALLSPVRGGAWVVGRCADGGLRVAELGTDASRGAPEHVMEGLEAVCIDGVITLRTGELELPLTHPLDGLHALLPNALAPAGSVALFTGEALLVVHEQAGELVLGHYACEHGRLAPTK